MMHTGASRLTELCYVALRRYCFFLQIEDLCQPASSTSAGAIVPTAFAHFTTLCHILIFLTRTQALDFDDTTTLKAQMLLSIF